MILIEGKEGFAYKKLLAVNRLYCGSDQILRGGMALPKWIQLD